MADEDNRSRSRDWWRDRWTYTELRDDRVQAFADALEPGEHTFEYLARASVSGRFSSPPATVEDMYQPDVRGRTVSGKLEVAR